MKFAKVANVHEPSREQSEAEYSRYISEIKAESAKRVPDVEYLKELALITYRNRRSWIDNTPSSELRMASIFETFPCFTISELLLEEMALFKGRHTVSDFEGMCTIVYAIVWCTGNSM